MRPWPLSQARIIWTTGFVGSTRFIGAIRPGKQDQRDNWLKVGQRMSGQEKEYVSGRASEWSDI